MGNKITVEEINAKTEEQLRDIKPDHVKDMKPEVLKRYKERMAEFDGAQPAAPARPSGAAAATNNAA